MVGKQLNNLTERELLILLNEKVENLEREVGNQQAVAGKLNALEMRMLEQEVKWRIWMGIIGFAAGVFGSLIQKFLNF